MSSASRPPTTSTAATRARAALARGLDVGGRVGGARARAAPAAGGASEAPRAAARRAGGGRGGGRGQRGEVLEREAEHLRATPLEPEGRGVARVAARGGSRSAASSTARARGSGRGRRRRRRLEVVERRVDAARRAGRAGPGTCVALGVLVAGCPLLLLVHEVGVELLHALLVRLGVDEPTPRAGPRERARARRVAPALELGRRARLVHSPAPCVLASSRVAARAAARAGVDHPQRRRRGGRVAVEQRASSAAASRRAAARDARAELEEEPAPVARARGARREAVLGAQLERGRVRAARGPAAGGDGLSHCKIARTRVRPEDREVWIRICSFREWRRLRLLRIIPQERTITRRTPRPRPAAGCAACSCRGAAASSRKRAPAAVAQRGLRAFRPNLFQNARGRCASRSPSPAAGRRRRRTARSRTARARRRSRSPATRPRRGPLPRAPRRAARERRRRRRPPPAAAAAAGALGGAVHATLAAPFLAVAEARSFAPVTRRVLRRRRRRRRCCSALPAAAARDAGGFAVFFGVFTAARASCARTTRGSPRGERAAAGRAAGAGAMAACAARALSQQAIAEAAVCGGSAGLVHYCVLAATALRPSAPPTTGGPPIASGLLPAVARVRELGAPFAASRRSRQRRRPGTRASRPASA